METRRLGRTGHMSTVVTFGTASLGAVDQDTADRAIELVIKHHVNHIDIAPSYGEAMDRMRPWMPKIRETVFLGAKTQKRSRDEAWKEMEECLRRLSIKRFDLFQLHAVSSMEDLDSATNPGGAIDAFLQMREQGLIRWIGITSHGPMAPAIEMEALRRFDFDTIMFPWNIALSKNPEYRKDVEQLISEASENDVGIQCIKMLARGGWGDKGREYATWYDPYREQSDIDIALWWLLSQPIHTAPSSGDVRLLPKILDAAERFHPITKERQEQAAQGQTAPIPEPRLGILS